jgi:hypothetical protein
LGLSLPGNVKCGSAKNEVGTVGSEPDGRQTAC